MEIGNDTVEIKATIKKMFSGGQRENGWFGCFAHIRGEDENIRLFGITAQPITEGLQIKAKIKKSEKYDGGYEASDIQIITKTTKGIINYLKAVKGISKYTAEKIVMMYENNTIDIIKTDPDRVKQECSLSDKQIEEILKVVNSNDTINKLQSMFPELSSKTIVDRILKLEPYPIKRTYDNPYWLEEIPGITFETADAIALKIGTDPTSPYRINHGIVHMLESDMSNNLYINLSNQEELQKLCHSIEHLLHIQFADGVNEFAYRLLALSQIEDSPITIEQYKNEYHLYLTDTYQHMMWLIEWINSMNEKDKNILDRFDNFDAAVKRQIAFYETSRDDGVVIRLTDEQKDAVKNALENRLSIITGGPGRGKTTIVDCIASCWPNKNILLLAPTGRASNKLKRDTGGKYAAMTVDRYICKCKREKGYVTTSNTLIIVDESSMLDIEKTYQLFRYAHVAHICLVGDVDQLPPIQPGYVLKDAILSNQITTSYLTKSLRCTGKILENAEKIRTKNTDLQYDFKEMSFFTQEDEDQKAIDTILLQYNRMREKYPDEAQVALLSPMRSSLTGTINLNIIIQDIACPKNEDAQPTYINNHHMYMITTKGYPIPNTIYGNSTKYTQLRVGDTVINTKNQTIDTYMYPDNNYWVGEAIKSETSNGIFNGECGKIIAYIPKDVNGVDFNYIVVQLFDNRIMTLNLTKGEFEHFELGYAITVHKAQGSEYQAVIYISPKRMATDAMINLGFTNRNLLYTAITRAKERMIIIGSKEALTECIIHDIKPANSNFAERLKIA